MKLSLLLISGFCLFTSFAHADGSVKILVGLSPAGSFTAKSDKVKGDLIKSGDQFSSDKLSVSIESLKTGMSLRDEHLAKHLNGAAFPKIILSQLKGSGGKAKGIFEINGVKKEIEMSYEDKGDEILTKFNLNTSDFKLPKVKYLGIEVNEVITGEAKVTFQRK